MCDEVKIVRKWSEKMNMLVTKHKFDFYRNLNYNSKLHQNGGTLNDLNKTVRKYQPG